MSSSNGVEKLENPPETQDNKASSEKAEDKTPKKATKGKKDKNDPTRFQGQGINFKAKMIGIEDVQDARGDKMCQEAMQKLKAAVKVAGEHKQRITINVSLDGLKIMDEKSASIIHHHAVHKISFISRDTTDARAFGYVYGQGDGTHQFFGIKTEKVAEGLVLTLRDLFQVVFEMKKQEVEEAKKKQEEEKENAENRKIEVPSSNEPVEEKATEGKADGGGEGNLLDLENELFSIQQGIDQMSTFSPSATQGNGTTTPDPFDTTMAWGNTGSLASPASANSFQSSNSSQGFGALGAFPVSFPQQPQNDPFVTQPAAGLSPPVRTAAPSQANPFGGNAFVPRPTPGAGAAPAVAGFPTQQPAAPFGALPPQQQNTGGFGAFPAPGQQQAFPAPGQQQQQAFPAPGQQQQQAFPAPGQQQQQAFPAPGQQQALGDFGTFPPVTQAQPATSFNAFGSPQPAVQNQAAQPDPFKNDPFFSSTPAAGSQANQGDRYAAFGGMSQIQTDTSTSSSLFGDSSVFGSTPAAPAAPASISSANNAFAADPFQILSPTPTQPPLQQQPQQQAQEAPKTRKCQQSI